MIEYEFKGAYDSAANASGLTVGTGNVRHNIEGKGRGLWSMQKARFIWKEDEYTEDSSILVSNAGPGNTGTGAFRPVNTHKTVRVVSRLLKPNERVRAGRTR